LVVDADEPGDIGRLTPHPCLNKSDGMAGFGQPDDPVVPLLFIVRRSAHLSLISLLELGQVGRYTAGERIQLGIGQNRHHLGGIRRSKVSTSRSVRSSSLDDAGMDRSSQVP
jgi:hypothetical protein